MTQAYTFLIATLLCWLSACAIAQTTPQGTKIVTRHKLIQTQAILDTNEVVYDENGNALRFYQSQKLLNTGEYTLTSDGPPDQPGSKKHLLKLTAAQQVAAYERLKTLMEIPSPYLKENKPLDITPLLYAIDKPELDQKVIVLIFWNADCPPCTESFSALNDFFAQINNPERIIVLAVTNDDKSVATTKLNEKPLTHAQIISNAGSVTSGYDLKVYPAFVVTDKDHIIRFAAKGIGPITIAAFKNAVRSVLYQ